MLHCYTDDILKVKQVRDPAWPVLRLYDLNFCEYEMLIERELRLFFTVFLKTVNNLLRIRLISFSQQKN